MGIFEAMAGQNLDTVSFIHDFKTGKVRTKPKIRIPKQYEFIKKVLKTRGGGHEKMVFHYNPKVNLKAIVAIHDSLLGIPLGGTRMRNDYENEEAAVIDAADLAEGMSNKGFWAGTGTSGGKIVIMGDPVIDKTREFLAAYADFLERFAGQIITGEDMNISSADCSIAAQRTKYITGAREKSGDPSPKTAYGVLLGIKAAMKLLWDDSSFRDITVAVKGITGKVGSNLAQYLADEGANLIGSYWEHEKGGREKAEEIAKKLGVKIVADKDIFSQKYNILSLNAIGKELNERTIPQIPKGTIIGGAANNQLADPRDYLGDTLFKKGIWYLPDFVLNAGGVINVSDELEKGGYSEKRSLKKIEVVGLNIPWILNISRAQKISPHRIADMLPRLFIKEARQRKYKIK